MRQSIVQSLWIGPRLSVMEQLAIRSFLHHGHPFHLYTYGPVKNVPAGTVIRSGNEIVRASDIVRYDADGADQGSAAGFVNSFRFKLLLERGGWWTDLDSVCVRSFDFTDEHVLGYELVPDGRKQVAVGLVKASAGSPLMELCWRKCEVVDRSRFVASDLGPQLIEDALKEFHGPVMILEPAAFYPINSWQVWQLIRERLMPERSYAINLWNSKWRRERLDPDAIYDLECVYEQLKREFGVVSPVGAVYGPGWLRVRRLRIRQFKTGLRRSRPALRVA